MADRGLTRRHIKRLMALRDETGKFSKGEAYYVGDAFQKPVRCGNCFHFNEEEKTCRLVSEEGTPTSGVISAQGACSLYNARAARIQMFQLLWGRGEFDGVAPEVARATAFMFTYAALDEEPPSDLKEKALFDPGELRDRFR